MKVIAVNGKILLANGKAVKPPKGGNTEMFSSSASGRIPEYQVGHAVSVLEINTNMFTSSAVGSLTE